MLAVAGGNFMKAFGFLLFGLIILLSVNALAQSPDSFMVADAYGMPGDTVSIPVYLQNTQFSVGGFTMRIVLKDSTYTSFIGAGRGSSVLDFEYFNVGLHEGSMRVAGIADLPGGNNAPLLPIGVHEMVRVSVAISEFAPMGEYDSLLFVDDSLPPDRDNSISDSTGYINEVPTLIGGALHFETQSGVGDQLELPERSELRQNYPNPFNAETRISFVLGKSCGQVRLDVFDVLGREVKCFLWDGLAAGEHDVVWDGRSDGGEVSASGIYFYRLSAEGILIDRRSMTLLK